MTIGVIEPAKIKFDLELFVTIFCRINGRSMLNQGLKITFRVKRTQSLGEGSSIKIIDIPSVFFTTPHNGASGAISPLVFFMVPGLRELLMESNLLVRTLFTDSL